MLISAITIIQQYFVGFLVNSKKHPTPPFLTIHTLQQKAFNPIVRITAPFTFCANKQTIAIFFTNFNVSHIKTLYSSKTHPPPCRNPSNALAPR